MKKTIVLPDAEAAREAHQPVDLGRAQHGNDVHLKGSIRWLDGDAAEYNFLDLIASRADIETGAWSLRENAYVFGTNDAGKAQIVVEQT